MAASIRQGIYLPPDAAQRLQRLIQLTDRKASQIVQKALEIAEAELVRKYGVRDE